MKFYIKKTDVLRLYVQTRTKNLSANYVTLYHTLSNFSKPINFKTYIILRLFNVWYSKRRIYRTKNTIDKAWKG